MSSDITMITIKYNQIIKKGIYCNLTMLIPDFHFNAEMHLKF